MLSNQKRYPAYTDTDLMPFGKYQGKPMSDVPASYLEWLRGQGCSDTKVANYIHNSWEAIADELEGQP